MRNNLFTAIDYFKNSETAPFLFKKDFILKIKFRLVQSS